MSSAPLQTTISLYPGFGLAGQNMTGAGQALKTVSSHFELSGSTASYALEGLVATRSGDGFAIYPQGGGNRSQIVGIFMLQKLAQNPPSNFGSTVEYVNGDMTAVMCQGRIVVQTQGPLSVTENIYIYIGTATPANVGKLFTSSSTPSDGVLIGGPAYRPDGTNYLTTPIRVIDSIDGLAIVDINFV
jgi:hypothetical protein